MKQRAKLRPSAQQVGAYGEKVVEAELLRRGWVPSNVNASIKNAADFDIFALKGSRAIQIRVKTCGPGTRAFQFFFRSPDQILPSNPRQSDFTILVSMGKTRQEDEFFVVPTGVVRQQIATYRRFYLGKPRRNGGSHKETGQWTLYLRELRNRDERPNYGFDKKWERYRDNWDLLQASEDST